MNKNDQTTNENFEPATTREWVRHLAKYRDPKLSRSLIELAATALPFIALWALAVLSLSVSYWLTFALSVLNGFFVVRLFIIQHDCGHGSYFKSRKANDTVGRILGVFTVTPYDVWKRAHTIHHSTSGNLDRREMGDIETITIKEYQAKSKWDRFKYRLYRNPFILFGFGPSYLFLLQNRLPIGLMKAGAKYWYSALGTNVAIFAALAGVIYFISWHAFLLIFLPSIITGATIGLWLFYVQHQFEETYWDRDENWDLHDAALHGSSHYILPEPLQWLTGNIGIHHVHHIYARIPFYRLKEVLKDYPVLKDAQRLTIRESLACVKLQFWDENTRELLSYRKMKEVYGTS
jgi:omega-6 fatty acid desaturase (delta-12 desaturase)